MSSTFTREAIVLTTRPSYQTQRFMMQPSDVQPFIFRDGDDDGEEVAVTGSSQVLIQARRCGDYYAEITGPKFCVSAVHGEVASALRSAAAQVPA